MDSKLTSPQEAFREEIRGFPAYTIQGGTSSILSSVIAYRGPGLPAD